MRLKEKSKERLKSVSPQQLEEDAIYQDWDRKVRAEANLRSGVRSSVLVNVKLLVLV